MVCFVLVIFESFGPSDHGSDGDSPLLLTERYDLRAFLGIPGPVSRSEMNFFLGRSDYPGLIYPDNGQSP